MISPGRYRFDVTQILKQPQNIIGGPSVQWAWQAMRVPNLVAEKFMTISKPIILFQVEDEDFVDNEIQFSLCPKNPNCQIQFLKNTRHVLHLEADPLIKDVFQRTIQFLSN